MEELFQYHGPWVLLAVCAIAFVSSAIHGAIGVAGGIILSAALAPIIGVAPIVPVVSVALLISHSARAMLNRADFSWPVFISVSVTAVPFIVVMALVYGRLSSTLIALVLGCVILLSIPMRHWAKSRQIRANRRTLSGAGAVYGLLAGVSVGPGILLAPFMLGYGLKKEAFVATLAGIALLTNITRVGVFGATDLLSSQYMLLGVLCGLMTIPGNWVGRTMLR
ncbi:MAG: sulfite exporter TauE/SafE family protein, partial [Pseudomonadota bacterium]